MRLRKLTPRRVILFVIAAACMGVTAGFLVYFLYACPLQMLGVSTLDEWIVGVSILTVFYSFGFVLMELLRRLHDWIIKHL